MNQNPPKIQLNSLINLYNHGKYKEVLVEANLIKEKFSNSLIIINILGAANAGLKKYNSAINCYKEALKINPNHSDSYNNIGAALQLMGDQESAIKNFKHAIKIRPEYPEAYNNMGTSIKDLGDLKTSIVYFKQAIKIKPNYPEAYYNIGAALKDLGELETSIEHYKQAIKIRPNYPEAYYNMGIVLQNVIFTKPNPDLSQFIEKLLDYKTFVRPQQISKAAISLLNFNPFIKKILKHSSLDKLNFQLIETILSLNNVTLLNKIMNVCRLPDLKFELLLTKVRCSILLSISNMPNSPEALSFQSALALQCFHNEYIYNQTDEENEALANLIDTVNQSFLNGEQPPTKSILCIASYKALHKFDWSNLIKLSKEFDELIKRQVSDFDKEKSIRDHLPSLNEISNKVSKKVKEQYEENPYPRWVHLGLAIKPALISEIFQKSELKLFDKSINKIKEPEILIAGCGTGQQSISTSSRFKSSVVLASDLSVASLSYAKRQTQELGINNIDYIQADILDLDKLKRKFDIIESSGVLHHMDDPMAGWKILLNCLKPGGIMKIGLYSKIARRHIVNIRKEIKLSGIGSSDIDMKKYRKFLINSNHREHNKLKLSQDFYSLSTFRDLIFHVKEHQFNLLQVKNCLDFLSLKFCGFENNNLVKKFKLKHTKSKDQYNLIKWNTFENNNPNIFIGMYQFWCQKLK